MSLDGRFSGLAFSEHKSVLSHENKEGITARNLLILEKVADQVVKLDGPNPWGIFAIVADRIKD
jgi:hypothetical protein